MTAFLRFWLSLLWRARDDADYVSEGCRLHLSRLTDRRGA